MRNETSVLPGVQVSPTPPLLVKPQQSAGYVEQRANHHNETISSANLSTTGNTGLAPRICTSSSIKEILAGLIPSLNLSSTGRV